MLLLLALAATAACAFLAPSAAAAADRNLLEVQVQGGVYVTQGTVPVVGNADVSQCGGHCLFHSFWAVCSRIAPKRIALRALVFSISDCSI
jgi:hypothetical protein